LVQPVQNEQYAARSLGGPPSPEKETEMLRFALLPVFLALTSAGNAQTAPSAAEIASYEGVHLAAHENDIAAISKLSASGADLNARDRRGRTPVHIAAFASHDDALRALAKAGADMNALEDQAYDVVTIAAVADDPDLMSLAIDLGNCPRLTTSPYLGTALIAAAHLGHVEVVRRLVEAGAPLDHVNNLGWTAMIEAVILGDGGPDHQMVVQILAQAGADQSISDRDGLTPHAHARARNYVEILSILEPENGQ
jgi:ankyrin repeat protein